MLALLCASICILSLSFYILYCVKTEVFHYWMCKATSSNELVGSAKNTAKGGTLLVLIEIKSHFTFPQIAFVFRLSMLFAFFFGTVLKRLNNNKYSLLLYELLFSSLGNLIHAGNSCSFFGHYHNLKRSPLHDSQQIC